MFFNYLNYSEPLFRPPSEANSLILQITHGCSWNKCIFCEMYKSKKFSVKPEEELFAEIDAIFNSQYKVKKVFLADGDAMVLSYGRFINILKKINTNLKPVRITAYASAGNLRDKTIEELIDLRENGLQMVYMGIESGDNEVLNNVNKGETYESTADALHKLKKAGIKVSVMILTGLGGKEFWEQHAINSAKIVNETQPEFLSTLVLSYPFGEKHFIKGLNSKFTPLNVVELLLELKLFIQNTNLEQTVFRSDHASNYMVLKGFLGRDKEIFLKQIENAISDETKSGLRPEWLRGL
ncbi:MAG: radical SAM protein [Bacteroidales bacterium]|nr:radical SAM protein [Bacteroidales bacterium]